MPYYPALVAEETPSFLPFPSLFFPLLPPWLKASELTNLSNALLNLLPFLHSHFPSKSVHLGFLSPLEDLSAAFFQKKKTPTNK